MKKLITFLVISFSFLFVNYSLFASEGKAIPDNKGASPLALNLSRANALAPLCGTYTIPGNYANFSAAIADLNANGVCSTGVTFNVAANFIDTAANLTITVSGTAAGPIIFQKSGSGANPLIVAGVGVSTVYDGIIRLSGADYVTFDGIDLQENAGNTTTTTQMEWGYALLKVDGTNGSRNNTIKNCTVTLNKTNLNATGIYLNNHTISSTTDITVTDSMGVSSWNKFYSNIISNVNTGVYLRGSSTQTYYDQGNEVGTTGSRQSRIYNYASTTTAYGVYGLYQNRIKVFNTNINNSGGAASTSTLYGIFLSTGTNSNVDIYGDTVTVVGGGTTTQLAGIYNAMGSTGTDNTVNIYNNVIQNCTYETATSATFYHFYHSASCYNFNAYGNKVINNTYGSGSVTATGTLYYMYILSGTSTNNTWQVYNNTISNNTRVQSTPGTATFYAFYVSAAVPTLNVYGNTVSDIIAPTSSSTGYLFYLPGGAVNLSCYNNTVKNITRIASSSAATYCYYLTGGTSGGVHNIYGNSVSNLNMTTTGATYCMLSSASVDKNIYGDTIYNINSTGGTIYGLYHSGGLTSNIYNNRIDSLTTGGSGTIYASYILGGTTNHFYRNWITRIQASSGQVAGIYTSSGTTNYFYNNMISNLQATATSFTPGVIGIYFAGGTSQNAFYNSVYLDAVSSSTTFGSAGIYASTTPTVDLRDNIIVNNSTPGSTSGFTVAYQRSSTTLSTYSLSSNNNDFHAGTPAANRLIFYDGVNGIQNIGDYKSLVTPADSNSFTENPPFMNVTTSPYNLHINPAIPTGVESAGIPISLPISITTDYDQQTRNATTPDVGADEGTFTPGDLQAPTIIYEPLSNTQSTSNRNLVSTITDNVAVQNTPPNDPRIYYKKGKNGTFKYRNKTSQAGNDYTFTIVVDSVGGLALGDTVFYYVAAQDTRTPTPNAATNPGGGSGYNPPGTTPPANPNYYLVIQAPMSGTYTIPGNYSSIAAAAADLNLRGMGGACTFNVAAGHTETSANISFNIPDYTLVSGPLALYPIIFQKSGSGANPLITAGTGVGTLDGIIKLVGTDDITFDRIDLQENPANTDPTTQMEWGYALLKPDGTNGCRNVTIRNCNITLNKANTSSIGIYSANHTPNSTTALVVTDTLGANSNNKFYSNIISNVNHGISITGYGAGSPYTLYDQNNEVGTTGNGQNKIYNYGTNNTAYGVYGLYQNGLKIFNTSINNTGGAPSTSALYGILTSTGVNSNLDIYGDTITLVCNATASANYGINNSMGSSGTSNTVNIYNNVIQNCAYPTATSPSVYCIYTSASAYNLNIYGNKIINNTYGSDTATATGTWGFLYIPAGSTTSNNWQIYNNTIANNTRTQSTLGSGTHYFLYCSSAGSGTLSMYGNTIRDNVIPGTGTTYILYPAASNPLTFNCYNNTIRNISRPNGSTGSTYCFYHTGGSTSGTANIYGNSISNVSVSGSGLIYGFYTSPSMLEKNIYGDTVYNLSSSGGTVYGFYLSGGTTNYVHRNKFYGLSSTTGAVYGAYFVGGTTNNFYNNFISDLQSTASTSTNGVSGLYISSGNTNAFYNTIYLNAISSSSTTFGSSGIYTSTTPTVDLRDNIVVNVSTPGPTGGYTAAFYRSSSTLPTYSDSSNNNCFYAGTPAPNKVIYYDGTNADSTIALFKARVAPRDNNSFSENPPFVNVSTPPYDLHISTTTPTMVESGGKPIASPFAITIDYDGQTRNATTPDVGADEGNFMAMAAQVSLTVIPGGFYDQGSGRLNMRDTVKVYLVDSTGCTRVDSAKGVLDSVTFSVPITFVNAETGNYYIFVVHRNHLAISSRLEYGIVRGSTVSYDFTTDSGKAYGYNMIKVSTAPVRWGMIPGDANQDYFVDGLDQTIWIAQNGLDGYRSADFNGDLFVDGLDQTIWILFNGQSANLPCWFDHPLVQREPAETRLVKLKEAQEKILKSEARFRKE